MGVVPSQYTAPTPLSAEHECDAFDSGEESLDSWLKRRAQNGEKRGASRTYVVCEDGNRVVGYYTLSAGSIFRADAPSNLSRNMPDPLPVIVLGRLAVDLSHQGKGIGSGLTKDAMMRALHAAETIGASAMIVHALNDDLRGYYERHGFTEFPEGSLTFVMAMKDIRAALQG